MRKFLPVIFVGLCLLCSCHVPPSEEMFIRVDQAVDSVYTFPVRMVDGTVAYDISFYTVIDGQGVTSLPIEVRWTSPSGQEYAETVSMSVGNPKGDRQLYRSNLEPYEYGEWSLSLKVQGEVPGFRGIGVICERKFSSDGAR